MAFLHHRQFLLLLCLLVSLFAGALGYLNKQKLDGLKQNWHNSKVHLVTAENTLAQLKQSEAEAQQELVRTAAKLQELSTSLAVNQEDLKKNAAQIIDLNHQLTAKEIELTQLQDQNIAQELKIKELTSPLPENSTQGKREAELVTQLADQKSLVAQLQNQVERAQSKIQDYAKKDNERQKLQAQLGLEGKILAVSRNWNFVVLSIGSKSGVTNNTEMLIKRGKQLVGKVRITSVEPSTSIADIISSSLSQGHLVQTGDSVIYENE